MSTTTETQPPADQPPLLRRIIAVERAVAAALLVIMLALIIMQTAGRYVFGYSFFWTEELARYCYVWMSFIAAVLVAAERSHINIELFDRTLGRKGRLVLNALAILLLIVTCVVLLFGAFDYVLANFHIYSPALPIPMVCLYGVVYLAFAGIAGHAVVNLIRLFREHTVTPAGQS
ncbi:TRAP-type C4-dicarboxylate transport system permease small subunit [Tamaricihabitans halophyticus]|uniref:TRAP-type C4-dicarboxylate transport system permease small subunit n=1 Tax=Tamaricihabitans halophyticus TaxID=1262583 RepID=A0A4R2QE52_9PSEU|nr:TRAP transporter small permease [Tamaricihabitans halophyticus]TCP47340.1 TRAP-type C4-dicarboxylate transport system permease small subunit [Tamaricihabitans halophyticus]